MIDLILATHRRQVWKNPTFFRIFGVNGKGIEKSVVTKKQ